MTGKMISLDRIAHTAAHELAREDAIERGDDPATSCCRGHCKHFEAYLKVANEEFLYGLPPMVKVGNP